MSVRAQIYNERIHDLLAPPQLEGGKAAWSGATGGGVGAGEPPSLALRESVERGVYVEDLTATPVTTPAEAMALLRAGLKHRRVASTAMNRESSRSHSVFTLRLEMVERRANGATKTKTSAFHLIDLAGSERQKSTGAVGERLREASGINKSLSSLAGVISALVDVASGKSRHVHYRDSK